jgi:hypothetical protein
VNVAIVATELDQRMLDHAIARGLLAPSNGGRPMPISSPSMTAPSTPSSASSE